MTTAIPHVDAFLGTSQDHECDRCGSHCNIWRVQGWPDVPMIYGYLCRPCLWALIGFPAGN